MVRIAWWNIPSCKIDDYHSLEVFFSRVGWPSVWDASACASIFDLWVRFQLRNYHIWFSYSVSGLGIIHKQCSHCEFSKISHSGAGSSSLLDSWSYTQKENTVVEFPVEVTDSHPFWQVETPVWSLEVANSSNEDTFELTNFRCCITGTWEACLNCTKSVRCPEAQARLQLYQPGGYGTSHA